MTPSSGRITRLFAFALCAVTALPIGSAFAETSATSKAAPADARPAADTTGVFHSRVNGISNYDGFDQFRDASGRPLPGWEYLFVSPG